MPHDLRVPVGTRLLHVGPDEALVTMVRDAFAAGGDRPAGYGVRHLGAEPDESQPDDRVLVSGEFLADADEGTARRVVTELGGPRVHVLVTLRPLAWTVGPQWRQHVQSGMSTSYEDWLGGTLTEPYDTHRQDRVVARWADAAGAKHVTVVVAEEADPAMLLRTVESLLGLPVGFLAVEQDSQDRPLTYGEVELIRLLNQEFRRRRWPEAVQAEYIRDGAVRRMREDHRPAPGEPAFPTPRWALDRIAEIGTAAARAITASGVRVIGDITALGRVPVHDPAADAGPMIAPEAASQALAGIVETVLATPQTVDDRPLAELTAPELARVLLDRGRRRVWQALGRTARPRR